MATLEAQTLVFTMFVDVVHVLRFNDRPGEASELLWNIHPARKWCELFPQAYLIWTFLPLMIR